MNIVKGYTFDDLLLIPKHSKIEHRADIDTSIQLRGEYVLDIPIVSSNMTNVTGPEMAKTISLSGGLAILHRFKNSAGRIKDFCDAVGLHSDVNGKWVPGRYTEEYTRKIGISIGTNSKEKEFLYTLAESSIKDYIKVICIDVAHGDHQMTIDMICLVRQIFPSCLLIAGNIATGDGAVSLAKAGADVIKSGVGSGCFAAGTRVLMSNGFYKNIEDINPGDEIINMDGNPKTVIKSFSTGKRKVSKLRNSISYKHTYLTSDHRYFIGDLSSVSKSTVESQGYVKILKQQSKTIPKASKLKWQEIGKSSEIALLLPNKIKFKLPKTFNHEITIRDGGNGKNYKKTKVDFTLTPSYELGYIFGTFLGDGHASLANNGKTDIASAHWCFGKEEKHIASKLFNCIKLITKRDLKIKSEKSILHCVLHHKPFAEFLAQFGKKTEKKLLPEYLVDDRQYLQGIHDGLVDSDGYIEKQGRICFSNTSIYLIELFNVITYLLYGHFPNNQKIKTSTGTLRNCNQGYISRINNTGLKRLFDNYQVSKLLEYSELDKEVEVFDLTIDCGTHSFIADNAIVHNSICSTRIETGNGVPQMTVLEDIRKSLSYFPELKNVKIISDGGISKAGDIVKALCFADAVMIGNLLAGTDQAPGEIITQNGLKYKKYAGSSTHKTSHVEGVVGLVPYKGDAKQILKKLMEGVRSGMSYQGARNIKELQKDPQFVEISNSGLVESRPHDVLL